MNDRIEMNLDVLVGKPVIKGTSLSVEFIMGLLAGDWTVEDVLQEHKLTREDVLACLAYAHQLLAEEKVYPMPV
jgi:uncharacterized protein (DUF433 family)